MTLRDLMGTGAPEVEVTGLAYSSDTVRPGSLFFCVRGFTADGHDFAPDAVKRGAAALVVERPLELGVPEVVVPDVRAAMGPAAARFHGDPTAELRVVGITGTNGKTTTAFLVREILEAAGIGTGLLGTVKQIVGGVEEPVERTTPEAIDLQATFRRMLDAGDSACAMEVSSHALQLGRASGIRFAAKVFTNLTQDHLDFHETMEEYYLAKRRLFDEPGPAVVNVDDPYGVRLAGELGEVVTFGVDSRQSTVDRDYLATDVGFDVAGARFAVRGVEVHTRLPGLFNVQNALAAHRRDRSARRLAGGRRRGSGRGAAGARAVRAGGGGAGLRRAGGLRAYARLARERAARRPRAHRGAAARGVRRGRGPRPRQAPADG